MKLSRSKLLIAITIAVLILGAVVWFVWQSLSSKEPDSSLQPKETVTIAGTRAISPCMALPESSVEQIYGTVGPKSYINEKYYASSLDTEQIKKLGSELSNSVKCTYQLDDTENSTVSVEFEQFASEKEALKEWQQVASYSVADTNKLLDELDAEIPNAAEVYKLDPEKLKAASESLRKALNAIDDSEESQELAGTNGAILYSPTRNGFLGISGNSIITVGYQFGSNNFFDEDRQIDAGEVSLVAGKIKSTFDVILKNIDNPNLSQAPSPAQRNTTGKIGETKILDACRVLSDDIFFTGLSVNTVSPIVERVSIRKIIASDNGKPIIPTNSCLKRTVGTSEDSYIDFQLDYLPNQEIAAEHFKEVLKRSGSSKKLDLQTKASQTKHGEFTVTPTLVQYVNFQQKGYVGTISISRTNDSGEYTRISEEKLQELTNKVVDQISSLSN